MSVRNILRITAEGLIVEQQIDNELTGQPSGVPPVEQFELSETFAETLKKRMAETPVRNDDATGPTPERDDVVTGPTPVDVPTRYMNSPGSTASIFAPIIVLCPQDLLKMLNTEKPPAPAPQTKAENL